MEVPVYQLHDSVVVSCNACKSRFSVTINMGGDGLETTSLVKSHIMTNELCSLCISPTILISQIPYSYIKKNSVVPGRFKLW